MFRGIIKTFILLYLFFLTALSFSWALYHIYEGNGRKFGPILSEYLVLFASIPSKSYEFLLNLFDGNFFEVDDLLIKEERMNNGFSYETFNSDVTNGQNILISTYNLENKCNQIKLIDIDSREIKYEWMVYDTVISRFNNIEHPKKISILTHPIIIDSNNIITQDYPYLTKINSIGRIIWRKYLKTHHSIELDHEKNLWVCSYMNSTLGYRYISKKIISADAIFKINPSNGEIIFKKTIFDILRENKLDYLITIGDFHAEKDLFHLNDIQPALYSSPFWEKGDLLISIRNRNTIFLYRPSTNKVIWLKTGPWSNQHDCDFVDSGKIMVFGNDIVRSYDNPLINETNNAYFFDLTTNSVTTPYELFFKSSNIGTKMEGRCDILPNGDLFVEETCNGRILIGDSAKVKLTYVDRHDKKYIKRFNWSRIVRDDEISGLKLIQ